MNRKHLLSALALLTAAAAGPAAADEYTPEPPFTSTRTRAEVIAELKEFQRAGVNPWADNYDQQAAFTSSRSREVATLEYMMTRDLMAAMHGEDGGANWRPAPARMIAVPLTPVPDTDNAILAGQPLSAE